MSALSEKKVVIFDFGNVLIRFDPAIMTAAEVEDPADAALLAPIVFDRLYWDRLDDGTISDREVIEAVCARLPERLHEAATRVYLRWYEHLPEIDGMREVLHDIKAQGRGLYLLSNISCGFASGYADVPALRSLLAPFDGLVFSGPLGMVKPQREIFHHLLTSYGLRAEDCVFVDDSPINAAGARAAGIETILFEGSANKVRRLLGVPKHH